MGNIKHGASGSRRKKLLAFGLPFMAAMLAATMVGASTCPPRISGFAFGEKVLGTDSDGDTIRSGGMPAAGNDPHVGGVHEKDAAGVTLPGIIDASAMRVHTEAFNLGTANVYSSSYSRTAGVNIGDSDVVATAVRSECKATLTGVTGNTTFASLAVGGASVVDLSPPPNTTIPLGPLGFVVLNEQIIVNTASKLAITVYGIHVHLGGSSPAPGVLDVYVAGSHCDVFKNQT